MDRALSPIVGLAVLVGIAAVASVTLYFVGVSLSAGAGDAVGDQQAEQSMTHVASTAEDLVDGRGPHGEFALEGYDGSAGVDPDAGNLNVTLVMENGNATTVLDSDLGTFRYGDPDGRHLAFQGGGVWRSGGGEPRMVSPPSLDYRSGEDPTLTIEHVRVVGDSVGSGSVRGGLSVAEQQSHYPSTENHTNPVTGEYLLIAIESDYAAAWEDHLESRTDGTFEERWNEGTRDRIVLNLSVPSGRSGPSGGPPAVDRPSFDDDVDVLVPGGGGSGSSATTDVQENESGEDSVDVWTIEQAVRSESNFSLEGFGSGVTPVVGDVELRGELQGDEDGVSGTVHERADVDVPGYPADWSEHFDGSRTWHDPADLESDDVEGVDVEPGTNADTIEIHEGGTYYLEHFDTTSHRLHVTAGDNVTVVVDGPIDVQGNAEIVVSSDAQVRFYVDGDVTQQSHGTQLGDPDEPDEVHIHAAGDVTVSGQTETHGLINAPEGEVTLRGNSEVHGSIQAAGDVDSSGESVIEYTEVDTEYAHSDAEAGALRVAIEDPDGDPYVAEVTVSNGTWGDVARAESRNWRGLAPGEYDVSVDPLGGPGYDAYDGSVEIRDDNETVLDVSLDDSPVSQPTHGEVEVEVFNGTVVGQDAAGNDVVDGSDLNATVTVVNASGSVVGEDWSGSDGTVAFDVDPDESYDVSVTGATGFEDNGLSGVRVSPNNRTEVSVPLAPTGGGGGGTGSAVSEDVYYLHVTEVVLEVED